MKKPVTLSWYWLKRDDGSLEKRYVVSTKPFSWSYISRLGKRRWIIEGFFKTVKHRFGLHRFGQSKLLGVYRFLVLSMIAYVLAHWAYLWSGRPTLPDWGKAGQLAADTTQTHKEFSSSKWFRTSCYRMAVWLIENGARSQFKQT
ncbi:MAG: transposase [Hydrococcus sp. Prado102]|nr:transposase [Hydrococcus sp. Prado102]